MNTADRPYRNYGARARLGLIVPPTNTVNEAEWQQMLPAGVTLHSARMPLHADTSSSEGKRMLYEDIRRYAGDLAKASPDVIAYGCTAGSMVTPITALTDFMREVTGIPSVATAPSLVLAARVFGATRVSVATPYHDALNEHERHFLAECGIEVVAMSGLGIGAGGPQEYVRIARVPVADVYAHVRAVDRPDAQAIIVSCTDFATLEILPRLERELGKPVVTSNLATFWQALRTSGVADRIEGYGRLLQEH